MLNHFYRIKYEFISSLVEQTACMQTQWQQIYEIFFTLLTQINLSGSPWHDFELLKTFCLKSKRQLSNHLFTFLTA